MQAKLFVFDTFPELYATAPIISDVVYGVSTSYNKEFLLEEGILLKEKKLCTPDCSRCQNFVQELNNASDRGHDKAVTLCL